MTRYWGIRTDTEHNTTYIWRELHAGRVRQGWGRRAEEDLGFIADRLAAGGSLDAGQRQTWRGNRRLLPTERDAVTVDDVAVLPHLPRYGFWTIVRVVGAYRYSIDDGRNFLGKTDFGHVVPVDFISDPIPGGTPPSRRASSRRCRCASGCGRWIVSRRRSRRSDGCGRHTPRTRGADRVTRR